MPTRVFSNEDGNLNKTSIAVSRTRVDQDIDLSFAKKPSGDVFKKTDAAAVKQAVKNLLLTNFSEKPFLPRFGGNLNSLLFALNTDIDDEDLEEQIINAIEIYEPRARVTNISSNVNDDQHQVKVTVTFRIVNTNETVTTNIDLTRLR